MSARASTRVACAWLIGRLVDPHPEFIFVPNDQVFEVAEREGAAAFHVSGAQIRPDSCRNRL
ncbi:MAG: hypothetical protein NVSMB2_08290 [Chloroflexota bacterium]